MPPTLLPHPHCSYVGPWTPTPEFFSNLYFKLLLKVNWTPDERYPKFQYKDTTGTLSKISRAYATCDMWNNTEQRFVHSWLLSFGCLGAALTAVLL